MRILAGYKRMVSMGSHSQRSSKDNPNPLSILWLGMAEDCSFRSVEIASGNGFFEAPEGSVEEERAISSSPFFLGGEKRTAPKRIILGHSGLGEGLR